MREAPECYRTQHETHPITQTDVDLCFAVFAIVVAMVKDNLYDEKQIIMHYGVGDD